MAIAFQRRQPTRCLVLRTGNCVGEYFLGGRPGGLTQQRQVRVPKLDDRFPLIVRIIADTVLEHGTAEVLDVPGDHQAALRREVRAEVRKRMGYGLKTYAHESMVIFVCDPIYDLHADEQLRRGAEAVDAFLSGKSASHQSPTRLCGVHGLLNKDRRKMLATARHSAKWKRTSGMPGCLRRLPGDGLSPVHREVRVLGRYRRATRQCLPRDQP